MGDSELVVLVQPELLPWVRLEFVLSRRPLVCVDSSASAEQKIRLLWDGKKPLRPAPMENARSYFELNESEGEQLVVLFNQVATESKGGAVKVPELLLARGGIQATALLLFDNARLTEYWVELMESDERKELSSTLLVDAAIHLARSKSMGMPAGTYFDDMLNLCGGEWL